MAEHTLKRKAETDNSVNNDFNSDEHDVTWGGKRTRYVYNYVLESFDTSNDSDGTESINSIQSKSTDEAVDDDNLSEKSYESDCNNYEHSRSTSVHTEYEVRSTSSSSCHKIDSTDSSDSTTEIDFKVTNDLSKYDKSLNDSDNEYLHGNSDNIQIPISIRKFPPPACFKTCVQCRRENPNPYYQYCHLCYTYRKQFFENKPKPKPKPKNFKLLKATTKKKESKAHILSQDSGISMSQRSEKETIKTNMKLSIYNKNELCNICFVKEKNGIFNHGKIGHVYCCYSCAKQIWTKSNKCPLCNVKIKFVTKMVNS